MKIRPVISPVFGDITRHVEVALRRKMQAKLDSQALRCQAAQDQAAQYAGDRMVMRSLGQHELVISPDVYWHWVAREGMACWGDKGFRKDLARDNPSLRARIEKPMDRVSLAGLDVPQSAPARPVSRQQINAAKRPTPILNQFGRAVTAA